MKTALLAASMTLLSETPVVAQNTFDPALRAVVDNQSEAWNRNDAAAWTKDFLDDARFINVRGDSVAGRPAIEKLHAFIFAGPYQGSHCVSTIQAVTSPSPDVAIVETLAVITNFKALPPGLTPTSPGEMRARLTLVLVRREGAWKIQFAQNSAISPVGMVVK